MAEFSVQKVTSFPTTGIVANRWYARLVSGAVEIRIANELGVLIPLNYVSVTGNETITGQKTFNNELLALFAENPVLRITALSNQSRIDFRTNAGLDAARILFNSSTNQLAISTNESNANIVISPHGTGKINLPNIPVGTGESLMRNAQGEIVRGSGLNATKFAFYGSSFIQTTYNNILPTVGSNSFIGSDLVDGDAYILELSIRDMTGSGGGGNLTFIYVRVFGVEFKIRLPDISEINTFIYFKLLIIAGSGAESSRSITTKILSMTSSSFTDFQTFFNPTWTTRTQNVNLSTAKTIEIKMDTFNTGPLMEFARIYKI